MIDGELCKSFFFSQAELKLVIRLKVHFVMIWWWWWWGGWELTRWREREWGRMFRKKDWRAKRLMKIMINDFYTLLFLLYQRAFLFLTGFLICFGRIIDSVILWEHHHCHQHFIISFMTWDDILEKIDRERVKMRRTNESSREEKRKLYMLCDDDGIS